MHRGRAGVSAAPARRSSPSTLGVRALAVAGVAALVVACGGRAPAGSSDRESGSGGAEGGEVTVFAAASLTEAFRDAARAFRETDGGRRVVLNLAGSQALAAQIVAGAPADLFASADAAQMKRVGGEGLLAARPVVFAENGLALVTEPGNPRRIEGLADLARPRLAVVLAAPEVPVGGYARAALEEADVRVEPVSLEMDVKQVLAKVALGEADAGIVYRSDVRAAGAAVRGVELPSRVDQRALYRIGVLTAAARPDGARRFVAFLRSPSGRRILRSHGFEVPGAVAGARGEVGCPDWTGTGEP